MTNYYYRPNEPRRIFKTPKTTGQYVSGTGRCTHCPSWQNYCEACRQELSACPTFKAMQEYERSIQAGLDRESGPGSPTV